MLRAFVIGATRRLLCVASGPEWATIQECLAALSEMLTAVRRLVRMSWGTQRRKVPQVCWRASVSRIVRGSAAPVQKHRHDGQENSTAKSSDDGSGRHSSSAVVSQMPGHHDTPKLKLYPRAPVQQHSVTGIALPLHLQGSFSPSSRRSFASRHAPERTLGAARRRLDDCGHSPEPVHTVLLNDPPWRAPGAGMSPTAAVQRRHHSR